LLGNPDLSVAQLPVGKLTNHPNQ